MAVELTCCSGIGEASSGLEVGMARALLMGGRTVGLTGEIPCPSTAALGPAASRRAVSGSASRKLSRLEQPGGG